MNKTSWCFVLGALALAPACHRKAHYVKNIDRVSAVEGTGIEARDMRGVAEQLSTDLLASPAITRASTPPRIAVLPVRNDSRFLIDAEIYNTLLTDTLLDRANGHIAILDRALVAEIVKERAAKRDGTTDGAQRGRLAGADYLLEGTIQSLSAADNRAQTDYVVVRFRLTDAETSVIAWSGRYEVKKQGRNSVLYQ